MVLFPSPQLSSRPARPDSMNKQGSSATFKFATSRMSYRSVNDGHVDMRFNALGLTQMGVRTDGLVSLCYIFNVSHQSNAYILSRSPSAPLHAKPTSEIRINARLSRSRVG